MSHSKNTAAHRLLANLSGFALVLWAGSCCGLGYLFVPVLFANFPREQAGAIAGQLFAAELVLGLICSMVLLLDYRVRFTRVLQYQRGLLLVLFLVCLLLVQYLVLSPMVAQAKTMGDVAKFGWLHGVSQVVYLLQSLALVGLVYERWMRIKKQ